MRALTTPAVLVLLASIAPAVAGPIEKLVLFPTADQLRVQVALRGDTDLSGLTLTGRITPSDGKGPALWEGPLGAVTARAARPALIEQTIRNLQPRLWSPGSPVLYHFTLTVTRDGRTLDARTTRFGFRSVTSRDGQILLNGKPIFLKGLAINPPGRSVPEETGYSRQFAYDYVRFMRSKNFNCIRMNFDFEVDPRQQHWLDACDELGMLVYQGCYGSPPAGKAGEGRGKQMPPEDLDASVAAYREVFETFARHPSVIIYILSNELPYRGRRGQAWHDFLTAAYHKLRAWDSTRLYIGNAGYGEGKEGDINDVHRYWGWYYNSFLTYYNLRKAHEIYGHLGAVQPFTFSECVGSFTSSHGEFNLVFRKQLGAQLHWTGHSPSQREDALAYQAFMAQRACESFRTMREINPRLAGLMPFTILFYNWNGITSFSQMKPKPVADAMAAAYQPVLLSWEMWTPQVYAGSTVNAFAHIVNDAEDFSDLAGAKLIWTLSDPSGRNAPALGGEIDIPAVPHFAHHKLPITFTLPAELKTGEYTLTGNILKEGPVSGNRVSVFVAGPDWRESVSRAAAGRQVTVYDPAGRTARALTALGVKIRRVEKLTPIPADAPLVIGEDATGASLPGDRIRALARNGGRVLLLGQDHRKFDPSWLPATVEMLTTSANDPEYLNKKRPTYDQLHVNPERPDHPVFAGLDRSRFRLWSDYTGWNQSRPGFPAVYPVTRGFKLTKAEDLAQTAILANYDRGLEGVAVCEMFDGKGSIVFTSLDLVSRIGLDPVADRMLANLVAYLSAGDHPVHPLIEKPIQWGRYATERGVITGPLNGLVVNCRWAAPPTDPDARPLPDNGGAWNILPGDQYVPFGRRPYGPYTYNTGTATVQADRNAPTGAGFFHATLPPGRRVMLTTIENPSSESGRIEIDVNGSTQSASVAPGQTTTVRNPLPPDSTTVTVRYTGDKHLVLLETAFE